MSWSERALLVESLSALAMARFLVKVTPEKRLVAQFGGVRASGESVFAGSISNIGAPIGAMLERAAHLACWRAMCLEKALAGKWMLSRRGVASTMYVGMARSGTQFIAHAWLVGDDLTITGAVGTTFATLALFTSKTL
jgi:hypothetical protein